jgi:uncharacterized membrane protein
MLFFYIAPFRWGYIYAILMRTYAYCHASVTVMLGKTVGWIPTNSKRIGLSSAFRETVAAVAVYVLCYVMLIVFAVRMKLFHFTNYNYLSIEFWILYNLGISCVLLWGLYKTLEGAQKRQLEEEKSNPKNLYRWHIRTGGTYLGMVLVCGIIVCYIPNVVRAYFPQATYFAIAKPSAPVKVVTIDFTQNRQIFNQDPDIKLLQEYLNTHGYQLAATGAGSPGNETDTFGGRTYDALVRFQKANGMPPDGYFGWATRQIMNDGDVATETPS